MITEHRFFKLASEVIVFSFLELHKLHSLVPEIQNISSITILNEEDDTVYVQLRQDKYLLHLLKLSVGYMYLLVFLEITMKKEAKRITVERSSILVSPTTLKARYC